MAFTQEDKDALQDASVWEEGLSSPDDYNINNDPVFLSPRYRHLRDNVNGDVEFCEYTAKEAKEAGDPRSYQDIYREMYEFRTSPPEYTSYTTKSLVKAKRWKAMGFYENLTEQEVACKIEGQIQKKLAQYRK